MVEVTSVVGNFRDELGKTFAAVGEAFPELYVVTADVSKSTRSRMFGERWPDRFYSVGIAEADAVGIAAGIASFGGPVIFTAYGVFATEKPFEQIRNCLCYPNLNVKIVATHGGISVGEDGATHQAVEDIAIMRALPNMKVLVAADPGEVRGAVFVALQTPARPGGGGPPPPGAGSSRFPGGEGRGPAGRLGRHARCGGRHGGAGPARRGAAGGGGRPLPPRRPGGPVPVPVERGYVLLPALRTDS